MRLQTLCEDEFLTHVSKLHISIYYYEILNEERQYISYIEWEDSKEKRKLSTNKKALDTLLKKESKLDQPHAFEEAKCKEGNDSQVKFFLCQGVCLCVYVRVCVFEHVCVFDFLSENARLGFYMIKSMHVP